MPERRKLWPLARNLTSSSAEVLGYHIYGDNVPLWIKATHRLLHRSSNGIWWLRHRFVPKHRYNLVRTGLKPGYYDQDTRMLHACFALLGDYIEEEGGEQKLRDWSAELRSRPDPNAPEGMDTAHADKQDEAVILWRWWKVEKPADEKRRDEMCHELFGGDNGFQTKPVEGCDRVVEWVQPERSPEWEEKYKVFRALDDKIDNDEQAMLHRLINIRQGLWT